MEEPQLGKAKSAGREGVENEGPTRSAARRRCSLPYNRLQCPRRCRHKWTRWSSVREVTPIRRRRRVISNFTTTTNNSNLLHSTTWACSRRGSQDTTLVRTKTGPGRPNPVIKSGPVPKDVFEMSDCRVDSSVVQNRINVGGKRKTVGIVTTRNSLCNSKRCPNRVCDQTLNLLAEKTSTSVFMIVTSAKKGSSFHSTRIT